MTNGNFLILGSRLVVTNGFFLILGNRFFLTSFLSWATGPSKTKLKTCKHDILLTAYQKIQDKTKKTWVLGIAEQKTQKETEISGRLSMRTHNLLEAIPNVFAMSVLNVFLRFWVGRLAGDNKLTQL